MPKALEDQSLHALATVQKGYPRLGVLERVPTGSAKDWANLACVNKSESNLALPGTTDAVWDNDALCS